MNYVRIHQYARKKVLALPAYHGVYLVGFPLLADLRGYHVEVLVHQTNVLGGPVEDGDVGNLEWSVAS